MRESRSDDILRHPVMRQDMSIEPAIARNKKARGVQRGKAFPLWSVSAQQVK
jgi:hypothetical protein